LKPGKQALYLPSAPTTSEFSAVLGVQFFPSFAMRGNHFDTAMLKESIVKWIAVVRLITNQLIRGILSKAVVYRILDKIYLVGRSAFHVNGDRKTRSVCDCHDLGALAALCLADSKTPFFAGAKLPCRTHCWNHRWQVWYGGYRWGKSFQGVPVCMIHNIPLRTWRGSLAGRPLGSLDGVDDTMMGSIRFHCSFVSYILIILHIQHVVSIFFNSLFK
jgi:hypothetical protein